MRALAAIVLVLLMFAPTYAADEMAVRVEVYRPGVKELTPEENGKLVAWSEELLKSANFNTVNQPDVLKQSVTEVADHYRKTVRDDYLVVSYPHARTFNTVGGAVTAVEIVVGPSRSAPYAIGLFTTDPQGRVVLYGKYAATRLPSELAPPPATRTAR